MRYAVLSDIHSNLEAFSSVLERITALKVDRIVCLGDIVGYNADPNQCVALIKDLSITTVAGNHDEEAASTEAPHNLNPSAEESILWTRAKLTEENKRFLRTLPAAVVVDGLFVALHSPKDTGNKYISSKHAAATVFKLLREAQARPLAFLGHTHVRCVFTEKNGEVVEIKTTETIKIEKNQYYLINPGSVGQPRGGDPRASFLVFDSESGEIEFHHVPYDIEAAAEKIRAAGLPDINAKRLTLGQ
ncbi:hypothetical protein MNBD_DELTA01-1960 [hydrothermal vent metagenome]|uniref:Calcineurin-like phosphoesterase domain-containing protein n=1 Tax=hydrothermal vent metagenome TaxID=652676 RepID=A0A3B0RJR0_9ZZZZ